MRLLITLLVTATAASPARAAGERPAKPQAAAPAKPQAAAPAKPQPAAQDLARALLPKASWEDLLDRYATTLTGQVSQSLANSGEPVPDGLNGAIRKQLGDKLPYDATMDRHAQALSQHLTGDELKKAADFYSSKVGSKVLRTLPKTEAEVSDYLQTRLASVIPEIVQQVAPKALPRAPGDSKSSPPTDSKQQSPPTDTKSKEPSPPTDTKQP